MPDLSLNDDKFKIINQIDINQKEALLSTKIGLYIINLKNNS